MSGPRIVVLGSANRDRAIVDLRGPVTIRAHAADLIGRRLAPAVEGRTVRRGSDVTVVTDGPYVETKEVIGGFVVIDVDELDAAVAVAREWPRLPGASGAVEVRRILD